MLLLLARTLFFLLYWVRKKGQEKGPDTSKILFIFRFPPSRWVMIGVNQYSLTFKHACTHLIIMHLWHSPINFLYLALVFNFTIAQTDHGHPPLSHMVINCSHSIYQAFFPTPYKNSGLAIYTRLAIWYKSIIICMSIIFIWLHIINGKGM